MIFIDEISMVESSLLNILNLRLQQIMGTIEQFGRISVVTVGDLFQLQPVFDKWIFENSQSGYNEFATNIWTEYITGHPNTQTMQTADCRLRTVQTMQTVQTVQTEYFFSNT